METLFDPRAVPRHLRFNAWKDALCGNYVTVDATLDDPDTYFGYIRYADFGGIQLSETNGPEQQIRRRRQHLSRLEKDCFYLQIMPRGAIGVRQRGHEMLTHAGNMGFYYASEPYELDCVGETVGRFLEIPRAALEAQVGGLDLPLVRGINSTRGIGKVLQDMCDSLTNQADDLSEDERRVLGTKLVDLTALAVTCAEGKTDDEAPSRRQARLSAIQQTIREHAANPNLNAARIAAEHGISARYLHRLFAETETSVMDFLWQCRLDLAWSLITGGTRPANVTDVAYASGFSSSSHFSRHFRAYFGVTPSEVFHEARRGARPLGRN